MTEKERHVYEGQDRERRDRWRRRSEPGGRAQRPAGGAATSEVELPREVRDRLSEEVIDELLAGARTEEEIVGPVVCSPS
jgi:hypothetical protein